jgi:hypothetical protein
MASKGPAEKKGVIEYTKPPKNPTPPWERWPRPPKESK